MTLGERQLRRKQIDGHEVVVDDDTSRRLGQVRQTDTKPERLVRAALRELGHHYRVRNRDLPGSPDIANRKRRWAIFVHGCYWHRHDGCNKATTPKRNRQFWLDKFEANRTRDARAIEALSILGYASLVLWECEASQPELLRRRINEHFGAHRQATVKS